MPRKPTGPREGGEFGYDPAKSFGHQLAENIRCFEEQADERGGLKPLVAAAKVPKVSRIRKRLVDAAVNIRADEPDELTFMHSVLTQCSLPTAKPEPDVLTWERRQGRAAPC